MFPSLSSLPEGLFPDLRIRLPVKPDKLFLMDMNSFNISWRFSPPKFSDKHKLWCPVLEVSLTSWNLFTNARLRMKSSPKNYNQRETGCEQSDRTTHTDVSQELQGDGRHKGFSLSTSLLKTDLYSVLLCIKGEILRMRQHKIYLHIFLLFWKV